MKPYLRPRRLRQQPLIRELIAETRFDVSDFIYPVFAVKGENINDPIDSLPGISHLSPDELVREIEPLVAAGLHSVLVFGTGDPKFPNAESAYDPGSAAATAVRRLKADFGDKLIVMTDVCACAYTDHGHCGILGRGTVENDPSMELIAKIALSYAEAGADVVAPSDMMDGRVGAIRELLDQSGLEHTLIMSYAVKYASSYYGPFRDAADSAPSHGDRKAYQMDFRNKREAIREILLDEEEGADILMVKPALAYLDIIQSVRESGSLPLACYNVSGEYAMVKAAAERAWIDERAMVLENMTAFKRAGADIIISYHTKDLILNKWI